MLSVGESFTNRAEGTTIPKPPITAGHFNLLICEELPREDFDCQKSRLQIRKGGRIQNTSLLRESFLSNPTLQPSFNIDLFVSTCQISLPTQSADLQHSKCERACLASPGICSWHPEESPSADNITKDLSIHWGMHALPPGGKFHKINAESEAPSTVGTRSTAQAPQTSHLHFSTYPCKQLISLVPPGSMFLTSQDKQSSVSQKRKKCRAATPNFSYTHHQFWICTRSLGEKKSISFEQSITI